MFKVNFPGECSTPAGSGKKATFVRVDDPKTGPVLKKTGETDLYAYIQSFTESTDYTSILRKMTSGDAVASARAVEILSSRPDPEYGDGVDRPDLRSIYSSIVESKAIYDKMGGMQKTGLSFQDFLGSVEIIKGQKERQQAPAPAAPSTPGTDNNAGGTTE